MTQVFVSHSMTPYDFGLITEAAAQIEQRGIYPYLAERDWNAGNSLPQKVKTAIDQSEWVVVFWTKGGANSQYVNQEIGYANGRQKLVILVVEKGVDVAGFEVGKEYIELDRNMPLEAIAHLVGYLQHLQNQKVKANNNAALLLLGAFATLIILGNDDEEEKAARQININQVQNNSGNGKFVQKVEVK